MKAIVNLPVADLKKSMGFFGKLGFSFNPQFTNGMAATAVVAGGVEPREPQDHGFTYGHSFEDMDGHVREPFWIGPARIQAS